MLKSTKALRYINVRKPAAVVSFFLNPDENISVIYLLNFIVILRNNDYCLMKRKP